MADKTKTPAGVALKAATKFSLAMVGSIQAAASVCRLDAGTLSRSANVEEGNFIPLDVAYEIDSRNSDPVILRAYAGLLGYDIVKRDHQETADRQIIQQVGDISKQSGDLVCETIEAISDGKLTPTEAKKIDGEAAGLEQMIHRVRKTAHSVIAGRAA